MAIWDWFKRKDWRAQAADENARAAAGPAAPASGPGTARTPGPKKDQSAAMAHAVMTLAIEEAKNAEDLSGEEAVEVFDLIAQRLREALGRLDPKSQAHIWAPLQATLGRTLYARARHVPAADHARALDEAVGVLDAARHAAAYRSDPEFYCNTLMVLSAAAFDHALCHTGENRAVLTDFAATCAIFVAEQARGGRLEGLGAVSALNAARILLNRAKAADPASRGPHTDKARNWLGDAESRLGGGPFGNDLAALRQEIAALAPP